MVQKSCVLTSFKNKSNFCKSCNLYAFVVAVFPELVNVGWLCFFGVDKENFCVCFIPWNNQLLNCSICSFCDLRKVTCQNQSPETQIHCFLIDFRRCQLQMGRHYVINNIRAGVHSNSLRSCCVSSFPLICGRN